MFVEVLNCYDEKWNLIKEDILTFCRENYLSDLDEKQFIKTIESLIKEKHPDIVGKYRIQPKIFTDIIKEFEIFVSFENTKYVENLVRSFGLRLEKKELSDN